MLEPAPPRWSPAPARSATELLRIPDAYAEGWDYPPEDLSAADWVRRKAPEAQVALEERLRRGDLAGGGFVEGLTTALERELGQDTGGLIEQQPLVWFNAEMLYFEFGYFDGGDTCGPVVEGSQWVRVMAVDLDRFAVEAGRAVVFGPDHIDDWLAQGSWGEIEPEVVIDEEAEGWVALWRGLRWPFEAMAGRGQRLAVGVGDAEPVGDGGLLPLAVGCDAVARCHCVVGSAVGLDRLAELTNSEANRGLPLRARGSAGLKGPESPCRCFQPDSATGELRAASKARRRRPVAGDGP